MLCHVLCLYFRELEKFAVGVCEMKHVDELLEAHIDAALEHIVSFSPPCDWTHASPSRAAFEV
jgi:hypothetical protein